MTSFCRRGQRSRNSTFWRWNYQSQIRSVSRTLWVRSDYRKHWEQSQRCTITDIFNKQLSYLHYISLKWSFIYIMQRSCSFACIMRRRRRVKRTKAPCVYLIQTKKEHKTFLWTKKLKLITAQTKQSAKDVTGHLHIFVKWAKMISPTTSPAVAEKAGRTLITSITIGYSHNTQNGRVIKKVRYNK